MAEALAWQCSLPVPMCNLLLGEPCISNNIIPSTFISVQQNDGDTVFMDIDQSKLCVVVQYNGEPPKKDDTIIRKLMRFNFVLRYCDSWAGNKFEWANDGVVLDIFDFCDLRLHLHDAHKKKNRKWGLHRYALRTERIAGGMMCTFCYAEGYPVEMFLLRTVLGSAEKLQSVQIDTGYKGLPQLLGTALAHVHTITGLPYDNSPKYFQTLDWHKIMDS